MATTTTTTTATVDAHLCKAEGAVPQRPQGVKAPFPKGAGVAQPKPQRTWVKDVIGIFGHIESRDTWRELPDGRKVPDTWSLSVKPVEVKNGKYVLSDQGVVWFNWHTYSTDEQTINLWNRFDEQIDLDYCAQNRVPLHIWVDERNHQHLEPAPGIQLSQCHAPATEA